MTIVSWDEAKAMVDRTLAPRPRHTEGPGIGPWRREKMEKAEQLEREAAELEREAEDLWMEADSLRERADLLREEAEEGP